MYWKRKNKKMRRNKREKEILLMINKDISISEQHSCYLFLLEKNFTS